MPFMIDDSDHLRIVSSLPKGNLYVTFNIQFPQKLTNE